MTSSLFCAGPGVKNRPRIRPSDGFYAGTPGHPGTVVRTCEYSCAYHLPLDFDTPKALWRLDRLFGGGEC